MPLDFNRYPRGLLSLLDAKVQGRSPQAIEDSVQGGLDFLPFWMSGQLERVQGVTANLSADGFFPVLASQLTVPQDEIWILNNLVMSHGGLVLQAGTVYQLRLAAQQLGVFRLGVGNSGNQTYSAGMRMWVAMEGAPQFLTPGTELGVFVVQATLGTAVAADVYAEFTRLKI